MDLMDINSKQLSIEKKVLLLYKGPDFAVLSVQSLST